MGWVEREEDVWLEEGKILGFIPVLTGQKAALGKGELADLADTWKAASRGQTLAQLQKEVGQWAAPEE